MMKLLNFLMILALLMLVVAITVRPDAIQATLNFMAILSAAWLMEIDR